MLNINKNDTVEYDDFADFSDDGDIKNSNNQSDQAVEESTTEQIVEVDRPVETIKPVEKPKTTKTSKEVKQGRNKKEKHIDESKVRDTKGKKRDKRETKEVESVPKPGMILYLIIDKPVFGILNYFRESGLSVSNIFNNIKDAKDAVLMQSEPTRIVVIDTGTGKFTTTTMRAELIDMLGISDEQNKTTVFYTDSVLKVDTMRALGKSGKSIDWIQYKSTAIAVATVLNYNENYVYDLEDSDEKAENEKDILNFKGLKLNGVETPRHDISGFSSDAIMIHLVSNEEGALPKYEVKL